MKRAAIDIGSNTVQFLILDELEVMEREQFVTSLGRDLDKTKVFHEDSIADTYKALKTCRELCDKHKIDPENITLTATEASRVATNAKEFFEKVDIELNLKFNIINSDDEAYYSAKGYVQSLSAFNGPNLILLDIGGASSEIIKVQANPFKIIKSISVPIGSVRLKGWMENNDEQKVNETFSHFDLDEFKTSHIVAMAGTATSLMGIFKKLKVFDAQEIDNQSFSNEEIQRLSEALDSKSVEDILKDHPFLGKRARVIKYGIQILREFQKRVEFKEVKVTTKSLVHGSVWGLRNS